MKTTNENNNGRASCLPLLGGVILGAIFGVLILGQLFERFVDINSEQAIGMGPGIIGGIVVFGGSWGAIFGIIVACIVTKNNKQYDD